MKTVITRVYSLYRAQRAFALCAHVLALGVLALSFANAQDVPVFANQIVGSTLNYDQASSTPVTGSVFYAKLVDSAHGIYSYTRVNETAVNLKPTFAVQTQTETGACAYVHQFASFAVSACGSGGIATAGGSTGVSGTGTLLATRPLGKKGWLGGFSVGPSYSGVTNKVTYQVGLVLAWGSK